MGGVIGKKVMYDYCRVGNTNEEAEKKKIKRIYGIKICEIKDKHLVM